MNITKLTPSHHISHQSSVHEILLALGLASSAQIEQASLASANAGSEAFASDFDVADALVARGMISSRNRDYVRRLKQDLRAKHEKANCPAAQFRCLQEGLRSSWRQLLGGGILDEAAPDQSNYPYLSQDLAVVGE